MDGVSPKEAHSSYSSLRERIVEHLFLGELLRHLWNRQAFKVELSRSESDSFGYDVVVEYEGVVRHIQLKSSVGFAKPISVAKSLQRKPGGCVIGIVVSEDLKLSSFLWLGNEPKMSLSGLDNLTRKKNWPPGSKRKPHRRSFEKLHKAVSYRGSGEQAVWVLEGTEHR
jgi:hypothetical protein